EPAEEDPLPDARELRQHARPRSMPHLDVAVRADEEHAGVGELGRDEPKQEQRRRIGPVEIVEEHEQRGFDTEPPHCAPDRLEELEPRVCRLRFGGDPLSWHVLAEQRGERAIRGVVRLRLEAPEDLHPRPVRRRALRLVAAPPAHRDAERGGAYRELSRDAGLSDARLAHEEHESSLAADGPIERTHQTTELGLAADEQIAYPGRHRQARDDPRVFGAFGADVAHLIIPIPRAGPLSHDPSAVRHPLGTPSMSRTCPVTASYCPIAEGPIQRWGWTVQSTGKRGSGR